jgi:hypothetical protein
MFIAALFTITKLWNQTRFPSMAEWMKKMGGTYTMGYYSTTGNNKILSFVAA